VSVAELGERAAPGTYPVSGQRATWRLTLHTRQYGDAGFYHSIVGDLVDARSMKLTRTWCAPAQLSFSIEGTAASAAQIHELQNEVVAWRWDDMAGRDVAWFRGLVTASEDQIDEESHTVTFTCLDYLALLARRIFVDPNPVVWNALEQDTLADYFLQSATAWCRTMGGPSFSTAAYLPLSSAPVGPDGSARAASGVIRTITTQGGAVVGTELDKLAKMSSGFDYDVAPDAAGATVRDSLRIFYPSQGVAQSFALVYPGVVTNLTRQVASSDYSNYWRTLGNNQSATQNATQSAVGEAWTPEASATTVGTWMTGDSSADQVDNTRLSAEAAGKLNTAGVLEPTYSLTLAPSTYYQGAFSVGDTLGLVVYSGRLQVDTTIRVMALAFDQGDDGTEVVTVVAGRSPTTLMDHLTQQGADIRALARR
jgi:hypothetical protein